MNNICKLLLKFNLNIFDKMQIFFNLFFNFNLAIGCKFCISAVFMINSD